MQSFPEITTRQYGFPTTPNNSKCNKMKTRKYDAKQLTPFNGVFQMETRSTYKLFNEIVQME